MSFNCDLCNKIYKSYQSLWNHNKKFHVNGDTFVIQNNPIHENVENSAKTHTLICKFCNRNFNFRNNRWKHEQVCKQNHIKKKEEEKAKELEKKKLELEIAKENNRLAKENNKLAKEQAKILKLKIKLQNSPEVDNPTMQKMNDSLIKNKENNIQNSYNANSTINSTVNSNNTINIVNNIFQIKQLGNENIVETLTIDEKNAIIYDDNSAFEKLIKIVHCDGKYPQFQNVIVTDDKNDPSVYNFDEETGIFNKIANTNKVMDTMVTERVKNLKEIYDDFDKKNMISNGYQRKNNYFFENMEKKTYKNVEIKNVKNLLFDSQDKITSNLLQFISQKNQEFANQKIENIVIENHDL